MLDPSRFGAPIAAVMARSLRAGRIGRLWMPWALLLLACSEDKKPAPPPEPPALEIQQVRAIGGGTWSPGSDQPLELGCAPSPVLVELGPSSSKGQIGDWILRPPGDCGGEARCGFVSVTVDPSSEDASPVDSAASSVQIELTAGTHVIFAEFRGNDGGGVAAEGGRVTCQEELRVEAPRDSECADAGTD
ncbi:MAG: hypothetical protein JW940_14710 [Polyangiaceae bacterium]|nr:hypothetical protein [Polyangiaceae bacterium]